MKKIIAMATAITMCVILALGLSGCGNQQIFDTNYKFDKAIIELANGEVVEVNIKYWTDYEDGEQLQITAEDGTVYLTSSYRCDLIKSPEVEG